MELTREAVNNIVECLRSEVKGIHASNDCDQLLAHDQAQREKLEAYEADMNAARGELGVSLEESPIGSLVSKLVMANRVLRSERSNLQQQLADAQRTIKEHQDEACAEKLHHQQATIQRLEEERRDWLQRNNELAMAVNSERGRCDDLHLARQRLKQRLATLEAALKVTTKWMKWWIENEGCDCEPEGHKCGLPARRRELEAAEQALAPAPGGHIVDANKMVWTKEKPTEEGWYWYRVDEHDDYPCAFYVSDHELEDPAQRLEDGEYQPLPLPTDAQPGGEG